MFVSVIWDDEPGGNVEHVAQNGLETDEVDSVLLDPTIPTHPSRSTGRPCKFGWTDSGKFIIVIWDEVLDDPLTIYPVTACEVPPI